MCALLRLVSHFQNQLSHVLAMCRGIDEHLRSAELCVSSILRGLRFTFRCAPFQTDGSISMKDHLRNSGVHDPLLIDSSFESLSSGRE